MNLKLISNSSLFVFTMLLLCSNLLSQSSTLRGIVYEKETGEPSFGTNVKIKGTGIGASTDLNGFYQITKINPGIVIIEVTNIEFKTVEVELELKPGKILTKNIYMESNDEVLDEFVLSAEAEDRKTEVKMSVIKATPKDFAHVVSVGGEPDFAQYLQTAPGVVTTGDQGGQMYIRGGSPIQNKVLLDGMTIYNPFHSIGFFSVFDTEIIRSADIYTGGFSAEYGGRISSVMDITTKDGNKKHHAGKMSINPFGAKLTLEGPILPLKEDGGPTISYVFSGKTSYLEQTSKLLYSYIDTSENWEGLPFNFTDLYGKVSINSDNGSKVNFFGFNYRDQVKYKAVSDLNWNASGIGTNFVVVPAGSPVLIMGKFNLSDYEISLTADDPVTGLALAPRTSRINGFNMGFDFKYFLRENEIKYGIEVNGFTTKFNFFNSVGRKIEQNNNTTELAAYIDSKIIKGLLVINPSFRAQYYASLRNFSPEPRIGLKYNLTEKFRIKAAGGIYSQNFMSANSDRDVVNLFYGFLSGPDNLQSEIRDENGNVKDRTHSLQKATHAILGTEFDLTRHLTLNVEGYYKWFNQLTNINRNKLYDDNSDNYQIADVLKKDYIIETGDAFGVDAVLKYSTEKTYIWFVYSLGKVTRWDGIQTYSPVFDRRHNINLVATKYFGKDKEWEINARWNLGSGLPFTQTQGYYHGIDFSQGLGTNLSTTNSDQLGIIYGDLNQGRLSAYHRLDLAIKRHYEISDKSILDVTASVTNVYSRNNIFYVDRVSNEKVYQLPILPSLGISWKF
ncbi:MAG: TonB-dependent receptor [Crocinitomicaceae bacterium]|nr:TonB-dependent receptor [Crocinitomicaceae bacterium]